MTPRSSSVDTGYVRVSDGCNKTGRDNTGRGGVTSCERRRWWWWR
ncbi:hypothetical protein E2C01_064039 [Portunus trituberculatus]|uniref:Uncharacterized protein n=1 Tax=Portunus trituberculatus TaxID=210409 RepID=A0A5B7HM73_PORTR|nr:hypothetical protein [Portunus trituberculatus]